MRECRLGSLKLQNGGAIVEFAIALPLLLLLLLAVAEFGRMLYHYNTLMQASRDASRYVAGQAWNSTLGVIDLTNLTAKAKNVAVYGLPVDPSASTVIATPVVPGLMPGQVSVDQVGTEHVRVRITYEFRPVIGESIPPLIGGGISLRIPLVATTVMRVL